jgi:hypothetical protein
LLTFLLPFLFWLSAFKRSSLESLSDILVSRYRKERKKKKN